LASNMQKLIVGAGRILPLKLRQKIIGDPSEPSWISTAMHSTINRLGSEKYPIVRCGGALKGFRMRLDWARYRSFAYGSWEPELVELISHNVTRGCTAVDVGAHIGYYTLLLSRVVGPAGQVFSFEPLPTNFECLCENLRLNKCDNVNAVNKAVLDGRRQIHVQLDEDDRLPVDVSLATPGDVGDLILASVSIDDFLISQTKKVDFLKVDAEATEDKVLAGAQALISRDHPLILIEVHHFDGHLESSPVPERLRSMGYNLEQIDHERFTSHFWATQANVK
jgi:FkbM family methyltransferase